LSTDEKSAPAAERVRPDRSSGGQALSFLKELLIVVVGAVIVSSLLRAFVGQMFIIPSESMESTLLRGDRVVVQKITGFDRGDVVVFRDPGGWLSEPVEERRPFDRVLEFVGLPTKSTPGHLIKRVIGLPGDTVVCCDEANRITINGYSLDESSYLYVDSDGVQVNPSDVRFHVVVPAGRIFVMGDHRDVSADSRCHLSDLSTTQSKGEVAFVPLDNVVGPAFAIVAPFSRASRLHRPANFVEVPAPSKPAPAKAVIKPEGVSC
jgi:signal peptidase I